MLWFIIFCIWLFGACVVSVADGFDVDSLEEFGAFDPSRYVFWPISLFYTLAVIVKCKIKGTR